MDYKATLNMPKSGFPMRAGLPKREPEMLKHWEEMDLYNVMLKKNEGKPRFALHDGPPFSNGGLHMGHALNKSLKDFITRSYAMRGYYTPYIPGWDNHGMPIESAIIKEQKLNRKAMSVADFRTACHQYADKYIGIQMEGFKRIGVLGDWEHPYKTMDPGFEAEEVKVFGAMYKKGYIYKGLKPVYWCYHDETALAEAEIEYQDDPCTTVYVKFPMHDDLGKLSHLDKSKLSFVIWTTTIWTLPGNLAIALHPDESYAIVRNDDNGEMYIVAEALVEKVMAVGKVEHYTVVETHPGNFYENMLAQHPFLPKTSRLVLADYVTMDSGTGCVHTAPGFGADDFNICRAYDKAGKTNIGVPVPVNARGVMTDERYNGQFYAKGNDLVVEDLEAEGFLLAKENITHSYPHCWRCKHPIIYRATEQWFCSVDAIKDAAVKACDGIQWKPDWGKDRMTGMITERNDWCISRQRVWGVPIPIFYCAKCGKDIVTPETIRRVSDLFRAHGSNIWFDKTADELVPEGLVCPECGHAHFTKESDIMDVWFDSGSTHAAVLEERPELHFPADMYMEGGDQFRGWFQSSLLTSVASKGCAPYKSVLCHGWVVDEQGKQMHKSAGNGVEPSEIIKDYGADIIRLWVASSDYTVDVRAGKNIFKQLSEAYRKIRNTARFILGNLDGFDPNTDCVADDQLQDIDRWALAALDDLIANTNAGYAVYDFNKVYHAVYNFCVVAMSNFYLDVTKDRLYCTNGAGRKAAQTTMYKILVALDKIIAPILCFTSQEIWDFLPKTEGMNKYVVFEEMPKAGQYAADDAFKAKWAQLIAVRDEVKKVLEQARAEKTIGASLEAAVTLYCNDAVYDLLNSIPMDELADLMIVSHVELVKGEGGAASAVEGLGVAAAHATGEKCERCWKYSASIGTHAAHPTLCARCASVVEA